MTGCSRFSACSVTYCRPLEPRHPCTPPGDLFLALRRSGALAHMRRAGVRCLEVQAVEDNVMARPLDPAFLGACAATATDCAAKVAVPGITSEGEGGGGRGRRTDRGVGWAVGEKRGVVVSMDPTPPAWVRRARCEADRNEAWDRADS